MCCQTGVSNAPLMRVFLLLLAFVDLVNAQTPSSPTIDAVFIIDKSSSFEDEQMRLQDNAGVIFDTLSRETSGNFRVAVVGYGGTTNADFPTKYLSLTDDRAAFIDAINLFDSRGGREPAYDALIQTTTDTLSATQTTDGTFLEGLAQPTGNFPQTFGFCPILVTDEGGARANEPQNTEEAVTMTLIDSNAVFFAISMLDDQAEPYLNFAMATGGERYNIESFNENPTGTLVPLLTTCANRIKENGFVIPALSPTSAPVAFPPPAAPTLQPRPTGDDTVCPDIPLTCTVTRDSASFKGKGKGGVNAIRGKGMISHKSKSSKGKDKKHKSRKGMDGTRGNNRKLVRRDLWYSGDDYYYSKGYKGKGKSTSIRTGKGGIPQTATGVPVCLYNKSKRIYTSECLNPYEDIARLGDDEFTCGCCSHDSEFTGRLPGYCSAENGEHSIAIPEESSSQIVSVEVTEGKSWFISEEQSLLNGAASSTKADDLSCSAENIQVCGRPDIFVYGRMIAMCRLDLQTRESTTHCIHPSMRNTLLDDLRGQYTCGCCDADKESNAPWYCKL